MQQQMAEMDIIGVWDLGTADWRAVEDAAQRGQDYPLSLVDEEGQPWTVTLKAKTVYVMQEVRLRCGNAPVVVGRRPALDGHLGPPQVAVLVDDGRHRPPVAMVCEHEWAYYKEHGTLAGQPPCSDSAVAGTGPARRDKKRSRKAKHGRR